MTEQRVDRPADPPTDESFRASWKRWRAYALQLERDIATLTAERDQLKKSLEHEMRGLRGRLKLLEGLFSKELDALTPPAPPSKEWLRRMADAEAQCESIAAGGDADQPAPATTPCDLCGGLRVVGGEYGTGRACPACVGRVPAPEDKNPCTFPRCDCTSAVCPKEDNNNA